MASELDPVSEAATPARLTMAAFWRDFGDEVLSLDRGLPWTFWQMLVRPGATVRRYVQQRDARVVRPLRYFLIGFAVLALFSQITGAGSAALGGFERGFTGAHGPGPEGGAILAVMSQVQWLLLGTCMPAMAYALYRLYRVHGPNFAEMWVLAMFVTGHCLLLWALPITLGDHLPAFLFVLMSLLPPGWFVATAVGYFPGPLGARFVRALAAMALAGFLMLLFLIACVAVTSIVLRVWLG